MDSEVHYFQIDIWGYTNLESLKSQVKNILLANDFILVDSKDLFETEQKLFHKAIRVKIEKFIN